MENQINNIGSNKIDKKIVIVGFFHSFLIFICNFFLISFVAPLLPLLSISLVGIPTGSRTSIITLIVYPLILSSPFLIFNTVILFKSENKSRKYGMILGYLFMIIIYILYTLVFFQNISVQKQQDTFNMAVQKNDVSLCYNLTEAEAKDDCFRKIAQQKNDPLICEKIQIYHQFENACYKSVAISLKNPLICEKMDGGVDRDQCVLEATNR